MGWCTAGRRLREKDLAQYFDPWCIRGSQHVFLCVCAGIHECARQPHTNIVKVLPGAAEHKEP